MTKYVESVTAGRLPRFVKCAKVPHQTGSVIKKLKRGALPAGWRLSKKGKLYYEARRNRSNLPESCK